MNHKLTLGALVCIVALNTACSSDREEGTAKAPPSATAPIAPKSQEPAPVDAPAAKPPEAPKPAPPKVEEAPRVPIVGKLAPEIVGEDIDGQPIKLSDYRGKVVMLDFWGHW